MKKYVLLSVILFSSQVYAQWGGWGRYFTKNGSTVSLSVATDTLRVYNFAPYRFNLGDTLGVRLTAAGVANITGLRSSNFIFDTFGAVALDTLTDITGSNVGDIVLFRSRSANRDIFIADGGAAGTFDLELAAGNSLTSHEDIIMLIKISPTHWVQIVFNNNN